MYSPAGKYGSFSRCRGWCTNTSSIAGYSNERISRQTNSFPGIMGPHISRGFYVTARLETADAGRVDFRRIGNMSPQKYHPMYVTVTLIWASNGNLEFSGVASQKKKSHRGTVCPVSYPFPILQFDMTRPSPNSFISDSFPPIENINYP